MTRPTLSRALAGATALVVGLWVAPASASFIETLGMGSRAIGLGGAFIGVADDLSANYYNPAGLTQLIGGRTMDSMITSNFTALRFETSQSVVDDLSGIRPGGSYDFDDKFPVFAATPAAPFGFELGERVYLVPLPIQVPFAGASQWPDTGDARFTAREVGQIFITWSPSLAFKATDWLSIGVGFDLVIANDVWLKTQIGDGAVGRAFGRAARDTLPGALGDLAAELAPSLLPKNGIDDGYTNLIPDQEFPTGLSPVNDVNLDFEAPGFHVGLMLFPTEWLRVGAVYRSKLEPQVEGRLESRFEESILENPLARVLGFGNDQERFELEFPLPQSAGLGMSAQLTNQWMVAVDYTWMDWSARADDDISLGGDGLSETIITSGFKRLIIPRRNWKDVHSVRAGVEWKPLEVLSLTSGVWYDPSPTPDSNYDFTGDPGDRISVAGGIQVLSLFDDTLDVGAHFQYVFIQTRRIGVGESEILGGARELAIPDDNGFVPSAYFPNDTFSANVGGNIITWGLTLNLRM